MRQQAYELLQIENEQPISPRRVSKNYWKLGLALTSAAVISVAAVSIALVSHPQHKLEVLADNSPAAKRGAGLLLT